MQNKSSTKVTEKIFFFITLLYYITYNFLTKKTNKIKYYQKNGWSLPLEFRDILNIF